MKKMSKLLWEFLCMILAVLMLSPVYLIVTNSFKNREQIFGNPLNINGAEGNIFQFYLTAIDKMNFWPALINSLIVTVLSVLLITTLASMAAWVLVRHKSRFSQAIFFFFTLSMLIPFQVVMIPLVQWVTKVDSFLPDLFQIMNTHGGLIFLYIGFGSSMAIFLFHGFIKSIPVELEEAARIDGCSQQKLFFVIVYPLLKPIIMTVSILNVLWIWNDYLLPSLILKSKSLRTIPLSTFYFFGEFTIQWNLALAGLVLAIIPVIIFFLFAQKHIIKGITEGAVKG